MFWSVCTAKGGSGASVLSAALALEAARDQTVLLIDWCGDAAEILAVSDLPDQGVRDWLRADETVGVDALDQIARPVGDSLRLIGPGSLDIGASPVGERMQALRSAALATADLVIVDLGVIPPDQISDVALLAATSDRRSLVVRACYLGLSRARRLSVAVDDVVEVVEPGRSLRTVDIEGVLQQPVDLRVPLDPGIARAVDCGLTRVRMPRPLRRAVRTLQRRPQLLRTAA